MKKEQNSENRQIGNNIIVIDQLTSTNEFVKNEVNTGKLNNGDIVLTWEQTKGKGQGGNRWESEAGKNLLLSVFLNKLNCRPENQFFLSMAFSLGILKYLKSKVDGFKIKWPNDVYYGDKKISGILIENTLQGNEFSNSIIGIGINLNQVNFSSSIPNPVSLSNITGIEYDLDTELKELINYLNDYYTILFNNDLQQLKRTYFKSMYRFEEEHFYIADKIRFKAQIVGIDEYGRLILKDDAGYIRTYGFKEVEYLINE